ncbi:rho guanine nucleotide exchange factor 7 [Nerophis ophidion]|uniref:rho guanine nucleotide exchange factor 7 n=1 Tax=Nerophis ophidion TaxID=159077 RepID=UPI002AE051EC|nr:rho guanine nucleotide exchange factor 7 [Nerophis ophidion]
MMGCCSVTQRHTGVDEVGPDEIELLELSGDNLGVWALGETRLQLSVRRSSKDDKQPSSYTSIRHLEQQVVLWGKSREDLHHRIYSQQPIRGWEGRPAHMFGEIIHSSLVGLHSKYAQEKSDYFLVLFSFHLLLLSLDHTQQDFVYEGMLPLSGLSFRIISMERDVSQPPHMFEISSRMMEPKVFICTTGAELQAWMRHVEDRRYKSMTQPTSPPHCALSYLLPCDEHWKREELKKYLMHAPIWEWEGSPIVLMGPPSYLSVVHIVSTHRQGLQERLMVLFPQDVLLLSVDNQLLNITYQGRLPRQSIKVTERSSLPGRLEFELGGELVEPLQVSCTCTEDHHNWIARLQQPDRSDHAAAPNVATRLQKNRQEANVTKADVNGRS